MNKYRRMAAMLSSNDRDRKMQEEREREERIREREDRLWKRQEQMIERNDEPMNRRYYPERGLYMPPEYPYPYRDEYEMRQRRDENGRYMRYDDAWRDRPMIGYDRSYDHMGGQEYGSKKIYARGDIVMDQPKWGNEREERIQPINEISAMTWAKAMKNEDGTSGAHWNIDQTESVKSGICPDCNKYEFYLAMNMMYSDYCKVAKSMGVDKPEFYAHMAKAFLKDKDAGDMKLEKYMHHIADIG